MKASSHVSLRFVAMLFAFLVAIPMNVVAALPAQAVIVDPMTTAKWTSEVNGDFIQVGNGVLACDPGSSYTTTNCPNLHGGRPSSGYVNDFARMGYNVPSGSNLINGSSATLTVPAGASVVYAKLFWAGNTGDVISPFSTTQTQPGCTTNTGVSYTAPDPALRMNTVRMTVNGVTSTVTGAVTQETAAQIRQSSQALYYSSDAVVTSLFSSFPAGSTQTITVGNVYAPQGNNCFGGWALDVVYDFGNYVAGNDASRRRAIYQFDGHVRQFQGDPDQEITLNGLTPQGTGARAGFVAYEGDRGITGESVDYEDSTTPITELTNAWGGYNNMWGGRADGSVPYYTGWSTGYGGSFVNASVDAYSRSLPGLVTGDTALTLSLHTDQDSYLMQNAIVSVPIADITVYKTAVNGDPFQVLLPGQTPSFKITVWNSGGGAPVENIVVTDPTVPSCSRALGVLPTLPVGGSISYNCSGSPTSAGYTNMASVTAISAGIELENSNTTEVQIATIDIQKVPKSVDVPYGTPGTYEFTVTNTGTAELRNVTVSDPAYPSCQRTFATLAAGAVQRWECQTANLTSQTTNSASVSAQAGSPNQTPLTITDSTSAPAVIQVSNISLAKTVDTPIVRPGDTATFTFTVRNTGETTLNPVRVDDPAFPTCSRDLGSLASNASRSYTCPVTIADGVTNSATVTGTPPSGTNVTSTATVRVDVKSMTLDKRSTTTDVNGNGNLDAGDRVNYAFTVRNSGTVALSSLALTDPMLTGLSCSATTLAVGASTTCTAAAYTVTAADVQAGTLANTATVRAEAPGGTSSPADDVTATDTETLTPVQQPNITLTKTANRASVDTVGQLVTYTFTARNTGNVTLTNVRVADALAGVSVVTCAPAQGSSLAPNAVMTCTATRATTQADLTAGSVTNGATLTAVDPKGTTLTRTAAVTVNAVQNPAVAFTKAASPSTFSQPGTRITYTLTTTNSGNVPLSGVTIRDSRFSTLTCTQPATLQPGQSLSCIATYTTTQADVDGGAILNTGSTTANGPLGQAVSGTDDEVVSPVASPTIDLTKTPSRTTVTAVGQVVTYTFKATNTGNQTLSNVRISDPMGGLSALSCTPAQGSSLAPLAELTCTATYTTTLADLNRGSIANTASVSSSSPSGASITDTAAANVTATQTPAVTLSKSVTPTTATTAGTASAYSFVVTNSGNVTLTNVRVTDPLTGLSAVSCSPVAAGGSLNPGGSTTCTANRTITQADVDSGQVNNTATVSGTSPGGTVVQGTSSARVTIAPTPSVSITKTANPLTVSTLGQVVTYGFAVRNTGNVTLSNATVTDTRVTGLTCTPAAGSILAPNAVMNCSGTRAATQADLDAGTILNTATVRTERPGGSPTNAADDVTASDSETVTTTRSAAIDLEKTTTATTFAKAGDTIPYRFTIRNTGNVTLTQVNVSDAVTNLSAITCDSTVPATLAPGGVIVCTATKTVSQAAVDAGTVTNNATATGTGPTGAQVSDSSSVTVTGTEAPSIAVTKTASPTAVSAVGQTVTYTFDVRNSGNQTLTSVGVADPLGGLSTLSCTPAAGSTLAPNATMRCTATRSTTQADLDAGSITNTATATGTGPDGPVTGTDGEVVSVTQTPRLTMTKAASPTRVTTLGQPVTYTFTVTNAGNVTASNVRVTDPLTGLSALSCSPTAGSTLAPGGVMTCTATRSTTQADLDAGSVRNTATVNANAPNGTPMTPVSATTTVNVTQTGALSLDKTATPANATAATGSVSYGFTITNTGNVTVSNVQLTDDLLPAGSITCTPALGGSLAPGGSLSCTANRTITQTDLDAGTILNNARATATGANGTPVPPATDSAVVTLAQNPAYTFTKSASPSTVTTVGQVVTYSFTMVNTGDVTLGSVGVTDGMTGLSAINCPRRTIAPGQTLTCTATRSTTQDDLNAGTVVNNATARAEGPLGDSADPNDDIVRTATATVTATQSPTMTLVKTSDLTTVTAAGQRIRYTFTATNTGNVTLTDVSIADPLGGLGALTCAPIAGSTLTPSAQMSCTADLVVTQDQLDAGSIVNTATVTGTSPAGAPVQVSRSHTVAVTQNSAIEFTKSAAPANVTALDQEVTYTFGVRNSGNTTLGGVTVTDPLTGLSPLNCTPAAGSSLAPNDTMDCTATRRTTQADLNAGSVTNTATVAASSPTGPVTKDATTTVRATQSPALEFKKTAGRATYSTVGDVVGYTITAKNTGNVTLRDVYVSDSLPALNNWTCDLAGPVELEPGATKTCTASHTVTQADLDNGSIINDAQVKAKDSLGADLPVQHSSVTVTAAQNPVLTFSKSASPVTVTSVGQIVTYTFVTTNSGNVTLANAFVADPLPGLSSLNCGALSGPVALAPGQTKTCTATRAVT